MSPQKSPKQQEFDAIKLIADDPEALKARIDGLTKEIALAIYKIAMDREEVLEDNRGEDMPAEPEGEPDKMASAINIKVDRIHAILACLIMIDDVAAFVESPETL